MGAIYIKHLSPFFLSHVIAEKKLKQLKKVLVKLSTSVSQKTKDEKDRKTVILQVYLPSSGARHSRSITLGSLSLNSFRGVEDLCACRLFGTIRAGVSSNGYC